MYQKILDEYKFFYDCKNKLSFKYIASGQERGSQPYLVGEWLGLITLTDKAFIMISKFRSIVIDI